MKHLIPLLLLLISCTPQPTEEDKFILGEITDPPYGYAEMCTRVPEECK